MNYKEIKALKKSELKKIVKNAAKIPSFEFLEDETKDKTKIDKS